MSPEKDKLREILEDIFIKSAHYDKNCECEPCREHRIIIAQAHQKIMELMLSEEEILQIWDKIKWTEIVDRDTFRLNRQSYIKLAHVIHEAMKEKIK